MPRTTADTIDSLWDLGEQAEPDTSRAKRLFPSLNRIRQACQRFIDDSDTLRGTLDTADTADTDRLLDRLTCMAETLEDLRRTLADQPRWLEACPKCGKIFADHKTVWTATCPPKK